MVVLLNIQQLVDAFKTDAAREAGGAHFSQSPDLAFCLQVGSVFSLFCVARFVVSVHFSICHYILVYWGLRNTS